jgi:competence protein ComFC
MFKSYTQLARLFENISAGEQRCLLCFKPLTEGISFHQVFLDDDVLCGKCRKSLTRVNRWVQVNTMKVYAYYVFDETMSKIFHQYKEAHDQVLGLIFLHPIHRFDKRFDTKTLVCIPSSEEKTQERGFLTLPKILEGSKLPQIEVLCKKGTTKQSLRNAEQRAQIRDEISLYAPLLAEDKNLILFDDIVTTGSTMTASYELLLPIARSLKCVCIAIHPIFLENSQKASVFNRKMKIKALSDPD